jgi:membrane protein
MQKLRSIVTLARDRNLTFLAAGIAYYAFVSIIPLALLAVAIATAVGGEALTTRVVDLVGDVLTSSGQNAVVSALTATEGRGTASVVGFLTLTWSALKLFRGLDQAFDEVYADDIETTILEQVRNALVVIAGIGLAVGLAVAVGFVLSIQPWQIPFVNVFGTLALLIVITLAFLPIYYVLPPVDVTVRDVLPGAVVGAGGWVLLQLGFRLYAANAGQYAAYGLIGAVLLFVTWLYFAGIVVLLGAVVNVVLDEIAEAPA